MQPDSASPAHPPDFVRCWQAPDGYNDQFRIFDKTLTSSQKLNIFIAEVVLGAIGGVVSWIPVVGAFVPTGQILMWYEYTVQLSNMKFGGADPFFDDEFTACAYMVNYYQIGWCGLRAGKLRQWVDSCIRMGKPTFDDEMAQADELADRANPGENNTRFTNQARRLKSSSLVGGLSSGNLKLMGEKEKQLLKQGLSKLGNAQPAAAKPELVTEPPATAPPAATKTTTAAEEKPTVALKLEQLNLAQYAPAIIDDQGYDDLDTLKGMSTEELGALADDVGMKPGHKKKFTAAFA